jgi:membrane-anchored glycerophosphoryl diester phosphodiesterase (GDPDase)
MNLSELKNYRFVCTLTFGDIYGQIIVWIVVVFAGLASALSMMNDPLHAFLTSTLIFVITLPFLLFAFVTTLLNHIEIRPTDSATENQETNPTSQKRAQTGAVQPS